MAAAVIIVTQLWLVLSGNFAWLNWLTIVIACSAVDTSLAGRVLPVPAMPPLTPAPPWYEALVIAYAAAVVLLSFRPARNLVSRRQLMNASFDPFHLVNTYGAFGSISRQRYELVIEGTADPAPGPQARWLEYEFKGKPGDPRRRPRQVAPYHLRLDWLMWFAALSRGYAEPWLPRLLDGLLAGNPQVLRLLRANPFPGTRRPGYGSAAITTSSPAGGSCARPAPGGNGPPRASTWSRRRRPSRPTAPAARDRARAPPAGTDARRLR